MILFKKILLNEDDAPERAKTQKQKRKKFVKETEKKAFVTETEKKESEYRERKKRKKFVTGTERKCFLL